MDLFSQIDDTPQTIVDEAGEAILWPVLFAREEADGLMRELHDTLAWRQDELSIMGKKIPLPRLQSWHGDPPFGYTYSGIQLQPEPWTPALLRVKQRIEALPPLAASSPAVVFNSVLVNLYRHQDHVSWHADDEAALGDNPTIASLSLGATRTFQLKRAGSSRQNPSPIRSVDLTHGSLLLMRGELQHHWLHRLRKQTRAAGPRINLTFRVIHAAV